MALTVSSRAVLAAWPLVFGLARAQQGRPTEKATATVARLYKDFAWQALTSQPELFGEDLSHQPESVLRRYFTPQLSKLLAQDFTMERVDGRLKISDVTYLRPVPTSLIQQLGR